MNRVCVLFLISFTELLSPDLNSTTYKNLQVSLFQLPMEYLYNISPEKNTKNNRYTGLEPDDKITSHSEYKTHLEDYFANTYICTTNTKSIMESLNSSDHYLKRNYVNQEKYSTRSISDKNEENTYYVSTKGNDNNPGTIEKPFATWQMGFNIAEPGDTVYIRGGTYYPSGNSVRIFNADFYCGVYAKNKKGNTDKMINIFAYPGEQPVLDCRNIGESADRSGVILLECDYWHLKGLEITRVDQPEGFGSYGIYLNSCNYNFLEQLVSHDNGGIGIRIGYYSEGNLLIDCDAFNCYDPYSTSGGKSYHGGHADGIAISDIFERDGNERVNKLVGCRVWNNSDDGYDFYKCEGVIIMDHCWAWENGYDEGDGNGFKLGITVGSPEANAQRILSHCVSFSNKKIGFDQNGANVKMIIYNCVSYDNGAQGYNFQWNNVDDILRNNISFRNRKRDIFSSNQISDHNSWDTNLRISDADFISLNPAGVDGPRQLNGKLPEIKFLHLAEDSDLKGAGIKTGFISDHYPQPVDTNPDIGAFQSRKSDSQSKTPDLLLWIRMLTLLWLKL